MGNIEIFERIADKYDTPERIKMAKIITAELRKHVNHGQDKVAIDYGCGTGLVGMDLLDDFQSILFVDAAQNMIEVVEQKIEKQHVVNAKTRWLDAESATQSNLNGDYIFLVQVLLHVKDIEPLLSNLHKSLNVNGHLLIVDFDYNAGIVSESVHNGFKQHELRQTIEKIGFTDVRIETFYHGKNIFMNQDASLFVLDATKVAK